MLLLFQTLLYVLEDSPKYAILKYCHINWERRNEYILLNVSSSHE